MLGFLQNFPDMHFHMPAERREVEKLPCDWIVNVGATVVNQPFLDFVKSAIIQRNQSL